MRRRSTVTLTTLTVLATLGLAGCGQADAPMAQPAAPAPATATVDPDALLARLVLEGGMCADGGCRLELSVQQDGDWTRSGAGDAQDGSGTLDGPQLDGLRSAVAATALAEAGPFTGTCPITYDGQEMVITWSGGGEELSAASCEVEFPAQDPLPAELRSILTQLPRTAG